MTWPFLEWKNLNIRFLLNYSFKAASQNNKRDQSGTQANGQQMSFSVFSVVLYLRGEDDECINEHTG